jgi:hypothetical protein
MDLVYRFEADFTEIVPVGLVPEGIRLDAHFSGRVVKGPLSRATVRGIDYLLLRSDGVGVLDAYAAISTEVAQHVSVHALGYITPPPEVQLPPPKVILSPEFRWPDVPLPLHGFALYRTGAEDLAWMNRTALAFEGTVNVGTGKLIIEARTSKSEVREQLGSQAV